MLQGDQFTLMAMATEFRCNINVYQSFHPVIQRRLGSVEALHDIDICLITDLHYMSIITVLHIWVQLSHAFKNDAEVAMQLDKCKLYVQGDLTREEARAKVLQIIDGDAALSSLRPLIALCSTLILFLSFTLSLRYSSIFQL